MNNIILIGRLARDPELRFVPETGMAVTKITLAVDKDMSREKKQEATNLGKPTADFINVTVFGKVAENCANYLAKGRQAAVHGRISTGSFTTQTGEKRYTTDVIADKVEFIGQANNSAQGQTTQPSNGYFDDFPDDEEDIFVPVNDEETPF